MFQDEARFGRISDSRRCWCKKPLRLLVKAMLTHEYVYAYAAVSPVDGRLDALVLPHVNAQCMQLFLNEVARRYPHENLIMVVDGAGWHKAGSLKLPDNLRLYFGYIFCPRTRPNSTRRSTSGTSCAKSTFTTEFSTASTHWKINSCRRSRCLSKTPSVCTASPDGTGSLVQFLLSSTLSIQAA